MKKCKTVSRELDLNLTKKVKKKKKEKINTDLFDAIGHGKNGPGHHTESAVCEHLDIKTFTNARIQFHSLHEDIYCKATDSTRSNVD